MPRVKCASIECIHNAEDGHCTYKGLLLLSDCWYNTVNEGKQHFHRCKMFEQSPEAAELESRVKSFLEGHRSKI